MSRPTGRVSQREASSDHAAALGPAPGRLPTIQAEGEPPEARSEHSERSYTQPGAALLLPRWTSAAVALGRWTAWQKSKPPMGAVDRGEARSAGPAGASAVGLGSQADRNERAARPHLTWGVPRRDAPQPYRRCRKPGITPRSISRPMNLLYNPPYQPGRMDMPGIRAGCRARIRWVGRGLSRADAP